MVHRNRQPKTLLVVDDNPAMRGLMERALRQAGYAVLTAQGADEGLALADEHAVDGILLDLAMPDKSGLTALDELRGRQPTRDVPVLLVSGFANLVPDQHARRVTSVVQKPFVVADLLAEVERALK